ncbi:TIGR03086 family metal-binding protein [Nocardioides nanhaiensis]|uniref:Mycothiol-dependent maleylpyruvate isomerase metal-binding domain-containing protein n=1 Tax=Nocardioides nanhaiensis TaxID=1476871 RepID=A0ABP8VRK5_9ACTN
MTRPGPRPADPLAIPGLPDPVLLLERALEHTRPVLAALRSTARPGLLELPTPCAAWTLGELLAHMDDGLAAFDEGADGRVDVAGSPSVPSFPSLTAAVRVDALCRRSSHLLGRWSAAPPPLTRVDGVPVPTGLVALTAALEVAVHGWDVAAAVGRPAPLAPALARDLLEVAAVLVDPADRGVRFATALPPAASADASTRLLALLGRGRSRPAATNHGVRRTGEPRAS